MAKDPVCGMELDEKRAMYRTEFGGRIYYFCSHRCMSMFRRDPRRYAE